MAIDKSIFGTPFSPDGALLPSQEQMTAFFSGDGRDIGNHLEAYRSLIKTTGVFDQIRLSEAKQEDLHGIMVSAVLRYSRFVDPALLYAVELYVLHTHTFKLNVNDMNGPASFIRAAEQTMHKLNRNKLDDVLRMARLQEMINERKNIIRKFKQPASGLSEELLRIAKYIRGNLVKMEKHCKASFSMLADSVIIGRKEHQMVEDIKERPYRALEAGKITTQDLDRAVREVNIIADRMVSVIADDVKALKGFYEAILDRLKEAIEAIEVRLLETTTKQNGNIEDRHQHFVRVEQVLISFLSALHLEQRTHSIRTETAYEKFITQKRKEMLDYLFAILQKERRTQSDRRAAVNRRKSSSPAGKAEKRSGKDRRTRKQRRSG